MQTHPGKGEEVVEVANNRAMGFRVVSRGNGSMQGAPYGLEIIENCISCPHLQERVFCNLPPPALEQLSAITSGSSYPKGATLFVEGQAARGVFILCDGRIKLSTSSRDGKTLIVRIADPGEILGLPATLTGKFYQLTAEAIEPTRTNFISRKDFLNFLCEYGNAALRVAQQISETYHATIAELRSVGLARSAQEKLARFLLDWCTRNGKGEGKIRTKLTLTHEEIAQTIGASRETVTRLFSSFKRKELLQVKGTMLIIRNKAGLEELAG